MTNTAGEIPAFFIAKSLYSYCCCDIILISGGETDGETKRKKKRVRFVANSNS